MVPDYITVHLIDNNPSRFQRSSEDFIVIKTHSHYGDISFQVVTAKLWTAALFQLKSIQNIESFKSQIEDLFIQVELIVLIMLYMIHVPSKLIYFIPTLD